MFMTGAAYGFVRLVVDLWSAAKPLATAIDGLMKRLAAHD